MKPESKIYEAFAVSKKAELYFNEIKELTKLSDSSLTNTLKKFVLEKTLQKIKTKSNTYYKIEDYKLFALKFAEISLRYFKEMNRGVKIPLQQFLTANKDPTHTIVVFGSASKGLEKEGSDIDILIVTNTKQSFSDIQKEIQAISNYPLSICMCTPQDFQKNEDHLIIQAKKTGFPIQGEQFFYETQLRQTLGIL